MASWIDEYLLYTENQESPPLFHRWCALSTIAATVNRRVWLDRRARNGAVYFTTYPGQLSVWLVAGAGRCKKSTAVNIAKPFMREAGVVIFDGKMPPERMLRKIWLGDSSKAKYKQRSPREQAESAKKDARLDLPVPAVPVIKMLLPR